MPRQAPSPSSPGPLRPWKPGRRFFVWGGLGTLVVWGLFGFLVMESSATAGPQDGLALLPTDALVFVTPTPAPLDLTASARPTPTVDPSTPTPVLAYIPDGRPQVMVDYGPMSDKITALIAAAKYDVGVGFVDTITGQAIALGRGEGRFHAMSTFKGPLAAYYLWQVEHGMIDEQPQDDFFIRQMVDWSSNVDTTCVFERVGGIAGFNDWLAANGMDRPGNWVFSWDIWPCTDIDGYFVPTNDFRYRDGSPALGLPGDKALMMCPNDRVPCDKAMRPIALALFYARLFRGEIIKPPELERWLGWMEKPLPITSMFDSLPPEAEGVVHAYTKNGTHPAEPDYELNVYHEAGLLTTPQGTFALAVFMQGNPEYRGTDIHGEIGRIVYDAFTAAHANGGR